MRFLASGFKNRGEPLDDLIQVEPLDLSGSDRFEPDRGLNLQHMST